VLLIDETDAKTLPNRRRTAATPAVLATVSCSRSLEVCVHPLDHPSADVLEAAGGQITIGAGGSLFVPAPALAGTDGKEPLG